MPAYAYAAFNSRRRCKALGCTSNRCGIAGFCRKHHRNNTSHGHYAGRRIAANEYAYEKKLASAFLERHSSHEGLQSALRWLDRWMHQASVGEAVPGQREMARLAEEFRQWALENRPRQFKVAVVAHRHARSLDGYRELVNDFARSAAPDEETLKAHGFETKNDPNTGELLVRVEGTWMSVRAAARQGTF